MDLTLPATAVVSPLRARVLGVLARIVVDLTGRQVAAMAGGSVAGVARILDDLVRSGLVHRVDMGSAYLYRLNRDHLAAPAVLALASMQGRLIKRMQESLAGFTHQPVSATLFGSAARGDGNEDSDIDLFVVRLPFASDEEDDVWTEDMGQLHADVRAWTGNPLGVVEYEPDELVDSSPGQKKFFDNVVRGGIQLCGVPLRDLRRRARASGKAS